MPKDVPANKKPKTNELNPSQTSFKNNLSVYFQQNGVSETQPLNEEQLSDALVDLFETKIGFKP